MNNYSDTSISKEYFINVDASRKITLSQVHFAGNGIDMDIDNIPVNTQLDKFL